MYAKYEASYVATKSDQKSVEVKTVAKDDSMAVVTKKKSVDLAVLDYRQCFDALAVV